MPLHRIHAAAGVLAFALIASFWISTAAAELSGSASALAWTKSAILWAMFLLIPALAGTGISGFRLGKGMKLPQVAAKRRRMPFIALNGILILLPCAFFLNAKASSGAFDAGFYIVQSIELCAGLTNLVLIGRNIRDGLVLSGRRRQSTGSAVKSVFPGKLPSA